LLQPYKLIKRIKFNNMGIRFRVIGIIIALDILAAIVCVVIIINFRRQVVYEADSGTILTMGTVAHVKALADSGQTAENCIKAATKQFEQIEKFFSDKRSDSEISRVNREAFNGSVKLSGEVYQLIKTSITFSELSGGAFDITIGPLVDLWKQAGDANSLPGDEQIKEACSKVGFKKLILDDANSTVRFAVEGMRLDFGGIAKGYAVDLAVEAMKSSGATSGMVDIGGNIRCFGRPPKGKEDWIIGVQNPDLTSPQQVIMTLKLDDKSVATSGNYQRFVTVSSKRFSHIIEPRTGKTIEGLSSVTIITERATDADALSTSVTVMGPQAGLKLIEKIPLTDAIVITAGPEYKIIKTDGTGKLIKTYNGE
jgi:thiamine biosynthesis lipoprotein